jgi:glucokinase
MTDYSIGVDLGGTNLRAAAVDRTGKMLDNIAGKTAYSAGRQAIVGDMVDAIETLRNRLGVQGLAGIGVAVPGFIEMEKGIIRNSNNLSSLENFPIRDEIGKRLGATVILENDANAAAIGEHWIGAGKGVSDLVLITLGTGIGGGIISDGKILRGYRGMAGEIGHITVVPNGNPCGCGGQGCVEKHASATAIAAMSKLLGLGDDLTSKDVYDLAKGGNAKAQSIFIAMGQALGIVLAMLVNTFNYPLFLIGGGVIAAWDMFEPAMMEEAKRRSFSLRDSVDTRVIQAGLGNEAGLFGAAYLPWLEK